MYNAISWLKEKGVTTHKFISGLDILIKNNKVYLVNSNKELLKITKEIAKKIKLEEAIYNSLEIAPIYVGNELFIISETKYDGRYILSTEFIKPLLIRENSFKIPLHDYNKETIKDFLINNKLKGLIFLRNNIENDKEIIMLEDID